MPQQQPLPIVIVKTSPPCPPIEDTDNATQILNYFNHLNTLSDQELENEYNTTLDLVKNKGKNKCQLVLLTLSPRLSDIQIDTSKEILVTFDASAIFKHALPQKLLAILLDLAIEKISLLHDNKLLAQQNRSQQRALTIRQKDISQCNIKTKDLLEKIQKLEDVERIIIDRKETPPTH